MMKCDKFMQIVYFGTQFAPENFFLKYLIFIYLLLTLPYNNNLKKNKMKEKK